MVNLSEDQTRKEIIDKQLIQVGWKKALKLLNSDCPKDSCEWCEGR